MCSLVAYDSNQFGEEYRFRTLSKILAFFILRVQLYVCNFSLNFPLFLKKKKKLLFPEYALECSLPVNIMSFFVMFQHVRDSYVNNDRVTIYLIIQTRTFWGLKGSTINDYAETIGMKQDV